ncbi:hypothetical protein FHG64_02440 [Antarcticibacterium flavum]|uniref:Uncharacterized protein n=1 Tax=Antarcticibacterium flavum TaxID=2058175 RepID=A0A5B7WZC6_9FLAO|nr:MULTISPECIES: hypothetical protein [Antarcticibacterium]MCM4161888.1 hypothetical protein [Antarcticibacterium sp. W02-3]QCY68347.1 hypothetical protein FHG64_02440 [Antarcticibacterium flavum]
MNRGIKLLLIVLVFGIAACSTDDGPVNEPVGEPSVTAQIEEEQWEAVTFESAVNVIPQKGQYFELDAAGAGYSLKLSVLEFGTANGTITEGIYEGSEEMFLSLFMGDEEGDYVVEYKPLASNTDEEPFTIQITASTNSRISGTFSGIIYQVSQEDEGEYPEFIEISNGNFNNLTFETKTVNIQ